jgi:heme-degrading monooxygenase HmoA
MVVPSPAVAVIFTSTRTADHQDEYLAIADQMDALARQQPGYLALESVRDPDTRRGITISYWQDEASASAWKQVSAHRQAQLQGRTDFYEEYEVVVTQVLRSYGFSRES